MNKTSNRHCVCFEGLEQRRLMSVSVSNGALQIDGTAQNDNVLVAQDNSTIFVFENNILTRAIPLGQVNRIEFNGLAGNDRFTAEQTVTRPILAFGGADNDTI